MARHSVKTVLLEIAFLILVFRTEANQQDHPLVQRTRIKPTARDFGFSLMRQLWRKDSANNDDYTVFVPYNLPHSRGGKSLNLTLSPASSDTQLRIVNNPDLYENPDGADTESLQPLPPQRESKAPEAISPNHDDCICVPFYLCKNGYLVNSGGLTSADQGKLGKALFLNLQNVTQIRSTASNIPIQLRSPQTDVCGVRNTCCRLPPSEEEQSQWEIYPVATPRPDPPPSFPVQPQRPPAGTCGVRHAYGLYGRVQNLLYSLDVAEFGEYPWQAALLKKVAGEQSLYLCGGVLVAPQWIATAAHCLRYARIPELQVRLGEWDVHRTDEFYSHIELDVAAVLLHPHFSPGNLHNDLAMVRLSDPIDMGLPHITPACLPDHFRPFVGQKCWVSGWGKDAFGPQGEYQNVLKEVDVPILSRADCERKMKQTQLGHFFRLHPGFLCAGGQPGKDACTGDGGSPLVCESKGQWYVVGLVSWGIGCGQPGVPGVYVNMAYYKDWVENIILR